MIRLTCFILFTCSTISAASTDCPVVQTTSGPVKGKKVNDEITGLSHCAYMGIPYAQAPVGKLRFKPPVPRRPWKYVFDATKQGRVCPQREEYYTRDQMDEDCLVYNVYVPVNRTNELMPVFFAIPTGNFHTLSGNRAPIYGPELLLLYNVVVTINYRLGPLGFLSLCNEEISGNAGLKDIVLAMKTVHKNIEKFGGDPNKIALEGAGASAAICGYLMLIPETERLFKHVIIHSGSVLSPKYQQISPRKNALALARELNIECRTDAELIKKLQSANVYDMVNAHEAMMLKNPQRGFIIDSIFTPVVETDNNCAIIKESPLKTIRKGGLHDKPMLIGFNDQEGLELLFKTLKEHPNLIDKFNKNHELLLPQELQYPQGSKMRKAVAKKVWDSYMGSSCNITLAKPQNYVSLISDTQYGYPMDLFVKLFIETKKSPVYYFLMGVDTELNYGKVSSGLTFPGCARSDEIGYVFLTELLKPKFKNLAAGTAQLQQLTVKILSDFAKNGIPPGLPSPWPNARPNRSHVGLYNTGPKIVSHGPYPERMKFWNSIYNEFFNYADSLGSFYCTNDDNHSVQ